MATALKTYKLKLAKERMGAARPHTPRQGMIPWTHINGNINVGRKSFVPVVAFSQDSKQDWAPCRFRARRPKAARPDALHPVKIQENGREKGRISSKLARNCSVSCGFSPGHFPVFSLCPKACYTPSPAQHAEPVGYSPASCFAKSRSRASCPGRGLGRIAPA